MGGKLCLLTLQRRGHGLVCTDALPTLIHHPDEAEFERVCPSGQGIANFVRTPIAQRPHGSKDRAGFGDSELAGSTFAAETERMTLNAGKTPVRTNASQGNQTAGTNQPGLEM